MQIIPAILATSENEYKEEIQKLSLISGDIDGWVHIDFADDVFVPNKTIGLDVVRKYPVSLKKEAHLMVQDPGLLCNELISAGFERVILHLEAEDLDSSIDIIRGRVEIGIALNLETPIDLLEPYLGKIDLILFMGITPGFQGQEFDSRVLERIRQAAKFNKKVIIDGGVSVQNVKLIMEARVDGVVIGSHLLNGDVKQNLEQFKKILT